MELLIFSFTLNLRIVRKVCIARHLSVQKWNYRTYLINIKQVVRLPQKGSNKVVPKV